MVHNKDKSSSEDEIANVNVLRRNRICRRRRKIAGIFNRLSRAHQRYIQTDDRQTDGTAIAYSERERDFTFAKKYTSHTHTSLHWYRRLQWLQHVQHAQTKVSHSWLHDCRFFNTSKTSSGITDNLNACSTANRWHSTSDLSLLKISVSLPPDLTYKKAVHWLPSRPHLPTSCQNVKTDAAFPQCITCFTSEISTPMPKAIVHTTIRMTESGLQNSERMCLRSGSAMCAWFIDTMHFLGSATPSLNALVPRKAIIRLNRSATEPLLWAKINVLGHDCCSVLTLVSSHSKSVSSVRQPLEIRPIYV